MLEATIKGVIFDCDGVILDSEIIFCNSVIKYLNDLGINVSLEEVSFLVGQNMDKITDDVIKIFKINNDHGTVKRNLRDYFNKDFNLNGIKPMNGLVEFLDKLEKMGIKKMVDSSSSRDYLESVIKNLKLDKRFSYILSGDDFKCGKPSPDIYLEAIYKMGIDKDELVVIEDSINGIKASKSAGLYTIGFKGSVINQDTSLADCEVNDFSEIELIRK